MKRIVLAAVAAATLLGSRAEACFDPYAAYYTGMVMNKGETINLSRIESLTSDQKTYLKVCFTTSNGAVITDSTIGPAKRSQAVAADPVERCSYKFRSIADGDAMVFIGYSKSQFGFYGDVPRILVFFDTAAVPSKETKAAALKAELLRFSGLGILSMGDAAINNAVDAIGAGDGQYWSKQDTVLPFNMWFDTSSIGAVWGVKGVRGVNGGCGAGIAYELPERDYTTANVIPDRSNAQRRTSGTLLHAVADGSGIRIRFAKITGSRAHLVISDFAGHRVASVSLGKLATGCTIERPGFVPGSYIVSVADGGRMLQSGRLVLTGR